MTRLGRPTMIGCLFFAVLAATSWAQTHSPIAEQLAKTYGLDSWGQVDAVRYTWTAEFPGRTISHSWVWQPKTDQVSYEGKDSNGKAVKVTYLRSQLNSQPANVKNEIEPAFVNDNYWFMFPFHAYWDTSAVVKDTGEQKLPLGKGSGKEVVIKYPAELGGYTPGDTWTLFIGTDGRVEQFIYHRGGPKKPSVVITTWADYKQAGPLLVAMDHRGTADGQPFRISFSNVAVKLVGSDTWMDAQ